MLQRVADLGRQRCCGFRILLARCRFLDLVRPWCSLLGPRRRLRGRSDRDDPCWVRGLAGRVRPLDQPAVSFRVGAVGVTQRSGEVLGDIAGVSLAVAARPVRVVLPRWRMPAQVAQPLHLGAVEARGPFKERVADGFGEEVVTFVGELDVDLVVSIPALHLDVHRVGEVVENLADLRNGRCPLRSDRTGDHTSNPLGQLGLGGWRRVDGCNTFVPFDMGNRLA